MAVVFDNSGEADGSATSPTTVTFLVGSGTNRALIAMACFASATLPASLAVVWDSVGANQSLTQITGAIGTQVAGTCAAIFGLVNPTSGTKILTMTWTGSVNDAYLCGASWTGVDQTGGDTTFPNGVGTTNASGGTGTITITRQTNNAIAACFTCAQTTTAQSDTAIFYDHSGNNVNASGNRAAGSASHALTNTFGGTDSYAAAGTDIAAVGAGGDVLMPMICM